MATGLAAAAHGGFTTVCLMPNTTPAIDEPSVVARIRSLGARLGLAGPGARPRRRDGRPGRGDPRRARGAGRCRRRRVLGRRRRRSARPRSSATALAYAGALGLPIVDHPEDPSLTEGAEAGEGYVATVLGPQGLAGIGGGRIGRALDRDPRRRRPRRPRVPSPPDARLDGGVALAHVRAAKAAGLPVTCDVTPHHLALTDGWIAGVRRWAWESVDGDGRALDPWTDGGDRRPAVRHVAAGQPAAPARGGRGGRARGARRRDRGRHRDRPRAAHRGRQARRVRLGGQRDQRDRDGGRGRAGGGRRRGAAAGARDRGAHDGPGAGARDSRRPCRRRSGRASPRTSSSSTAARPGRSAAATSGRRATTRRCWAASCPGSCG